MAKVNFRAVKQIIEKRSNITARMNWPKLLLMEVDECADRKQSIGYFYWPIWWK